MSEIHELACADHKQARGKWDGVFLEDSSAEEIRDFIKRTIKADNLPIIYLINKTDAIQFHAIDDTILETLVFRAITLFASNNDGFNPKCLEGESGSESVELPEEMLDKLRDLPVGVMISFMRSSDTWAEIPNQKNRLFKAETDATWGEKVPVQNPWAHVDIPAIANNSSLAGVRTEITTIECEGLPSLIITKEVRKEETKS